MRGTGEVLGIGGSEEVMNELGTSGRPGDLRHGVEGRRGGVEEAWLKHCLALSDTTAFYKHGTKSSLWNVECGAPAAP